LAGDSLVLEFEISAADRSVEFRSSLLWSRSKLLANPTGVEGVIWPLEFEIRLKMQWSNQLVHESCTATENAPSIDTGQIILLACHRPRQSPDSDLRRTG